MGWWETEGKVEEIEGEQWRRAAMHEGAVAPIRPRHERSSMTARAELWMASSCHHPQLERRGRGEWCATDGISMRGGDCGGDGVGR